MSATEPLRFVLVAPFRTPLNFVMARALAQPQTLESLLEQLKADPALQGLPATLSSHVPERLSRPSGAIYTVINRPGRYSRNQPTLELAPTDELHASFEAITDRWLAELSEDAVFLRTDIDARRAAAVERADSCIRLMDNTVGVIRVTLAVDPAALDSERGLERLQIASNDLMERLARHVAEVAINPIVGALVQHDRARGHWLRREPALVHRPGDFQVFNDINEVIEPTSHGWGIGNHDLVRWVNRTLVAPAELLAGFDTDTLRQWYPNWHGSATERGVYIDWGNNIVAADATGDYAALWDTVMQLQCFAASLDLVNRNLVAITAQLNSPQLSRRGLQRLERNARETHEHLTLFMSLFDDGMHDLQGNHRGYAARLQQAWDLNGVRRLALSKNDNLRAWLNSLRERRGLAQERVIQGLLTGIGAVTVVDLTLALAEYARRPETTERLASDGIPGLLDLAAAWPVDGLLWGALGVVALVVLLRALTR